MIVFAFFSILAAASWLDHEERKRVFSRTPGEWIVDSAGLVVQGIVVPLLQLLLSYALFAAFIPGLKESVALPGVLAFLLNFVVVDYLYYWNHRALHHPRLWAIHRVHHGAQVLDIAVTSRNTLWTPVFILYLWVNGFFLYVLRDPIWFALGASLTAGLDLWRHTRFGPRAGSPLERALSKVLILPVDHAWHHSRERYGVNFGANLNFWDRLHGTYYRDRAGGPSALGAEIDLSYGRQLFWPWPNGRKERAR